MTVPELQPLIDQTLSLLVERTNLADWSVFASCQQSDDGRVWWSISVGHQVLTYGPGGEMYVARTRRRVTDGLVESVVNAAETQLKRSRERIEELSRKGA